MELHVAPVKYLKTSDYDIRLPQLGAMTFALCDATGGGVYIMYIKKKDSNASPPNPEDEGSEITPYCYAKVKLTDLEEKIGRDFYSKISRKADKLRSWVIKQDVLLSMIQSTNRYVKI